jgi:small-conductance mechanosensitive channel
MENPPDIQHLYPLVRAITTLGIGFGLAYVVRAGVVRMLKTHGTTQQLMLGQRLAYYAVLALFAVSALRELGFDFTALLGAAGIVTVAIGFASQTSASNLISGLFLIGEGPFVVGEVIRIGDTAGEVIAIDLLSVKLRTFDNLVVRVPNETVIKTQFTNLTRLPIRRYDLQLAVAYKENVEQVKRTLLDVADRNPLCLREPVPLIIFQGFGDSGVLLQLSVWATTPNFLALRNSVAEDVKDAFDAAGVEFPFPHRTLYTGSQTLPMPVAVVPPASLSDRSVPQ